MTSDYEKWIDAYLARVEDNGYGRCHEATREMHEAFPELRIAKGHVLVPGWGLRDHVWLVDQDGEIVDPTAAQFPGIGEYDEWTPGKEVRVGKCLYCGDYIWRAVQRLDDETARESFCSSAHNAAFAASLEAE